MSLMLDSNSPMDLGTTSFFSRLHECNIGTPINRRVIVPETKCAAVSYCKASFVATGFGLDSSLRSLLVSERVWYRDERARGDASWTVANSRSSPLLHWQGEACPYMPMPRQTSRSAMRRSALARFLTSSCEHAQ